jgi:NADP-dependent 3-hydroxy acid dehydrogenase YdfG
MSYDLSVATKQADGRIVAEATMDAQHVANGVLHIANLPNEIQILQYTIMYIWMPLLDCD